MTGKPGRCPYSAFTLAPGREWKCPRNLFVQRPVRSVRAQARRDVTVLSNDSRTPPGTFCATPSASSPDREAIAESSRGLQRSGNPRNTTRIASCRDARIVVTNTACQTIATTAGSPSGCMSEMCLTIRGSTLRFDPRLLSATPSASFPDREAITESSRGLERSGNPGNTVGRISSERTFNDVELQFDFELWGGHPACQSASRCFFNGSPPTRPCVIAVESREWPQRTQRPQGITGKTEHVVTLSVLGVLCGEERH